MTAPLAHAQEATDSTSGEATLGTPVEPRVGQPYIREEFGDWALRCVRAPEGTEDPCNLYQLLRDDDGVAVAEFSIFPLPAGREAAAGITVVVPLETQLTEQLVIAVDGQNARRYAFDFCNSAGCVARIGFTAQEVEQFKRGISGIVRIVPAMARDQEVVLDVSLLGFTAGYESVPPRE
ncbi:MAG: invasion associated locus B family protein [Yoonia sp.]